MKEPASYPTSVWNGLSDNPSRSSRNDDIPPDTRDWDRLVAEVIATQTALGTNAGHSIATMKWQSNWADPTNYVAGDVVYHAADFIFYVALSDNVGKTPGDAEGIGIWEPVSKPITGLPEITGSALPSDGDYVLTINGGSAQWGTLSNQIETAYTNTPTLDDRFETYYLDPAAVSAWHGTPLRIYRTTAAKATGQSDDAVLTANTALETAAFDGWLLYVVESPTGNRTNPVTTVDTANNGIYATVPNTGNTTWNAIVTSWNAAQADIVADLVAGNYEAGVTTSGNYTVQLNGGVADEVRVTTLNVASGNTVEAAVYGLLSNPMSDEPVGLGAEVEVQTAGTIQFTANQTVNVVDNSILSGGLMVPGEAYYAGQLVANGPMTNATEAANLLCVPIGIVTSTTTLKLRLGLPVKATVGA